MGLRSCGLLSLLGLYVALAIATACPASATAARRTLLTTDVKCQKTAMRDLGRRFPSIIPASETHCYTFNSDDMLSFGSVKVMLSSHSALEILVSLGDEKEPWVQAQLNKADQNLQELEATVKPGDINLANNRTLRVAVRNSDKVAVPFSMVALLPLPSCEYEQVPFFGKDVSVRLSRPNCYTVRVGSGIPFKDAEAGTVRLIMPPGMMLYVASSVTYIRNSGKRVESKFIELPPVWAANKTEVVYDTSIQSGSQSEIEFVVLPLNHLINGEEREEAKITWKLHGVLDCVQYMPKGDVTNADHQESQPVSAFQSYEVEAKTDEPTCFLLNVEGDAQMVGTVQTQVAAGIEISSDLRVFYKPADVAADAGWKRLFRSEQGSEIIDEQSVTEYKIPTHMPKPVEAGKKRFVKVMVNVRAKDDAPVTTPGGKMDEDPPSKIARYTIDFRRPELRCDEPEYGVLGKLEPGEPLHSERPVCYRVNIVQGNMRGNGIRLKASFTGAADNLKPMKLYSSPADKNDWSPMENVAEQGPQSRSFYAETDKQTKEMDIMVVSSSKRESRYQVMFDTEAPRKHATEAKITCSDQIEPAPFGRAVHTSLHALESRCFNFSIGKREELFDAVRITIRCIEPVKTYSKTTVVQSKPKPKSPPKHGGLLGLLEHLKQQFEGQEPSDWAESGGKNTKKAFWTPVLETASSNALHVYRYNLVHAFKALSVDKEVRIATSLLPKKELVEALSGAAVPASIRFDLASPRCSFPTRVALGVKQVGFVMGGDNPATACYFVAVTKEQMRHSDRVAVKVSPPSAAANMRVFVESMQSKGDDRLGRAIVHGDIAEYQYCAAREPNHAVAPCRRKALKPEQIQNMLLRVTLVSTLAARVSYSLSFETNGPSCKFPVAADHTGDYEYRLSISNKMHQCYQLDPPVVTKKAPHATGVLMDLIKGKEVAGQKIQPKKKYYSIHIELEDASEKEVLGLLRVYSKGGATQDWKQLEPVRKGNREVVFMMEFEAPPEQLMGAADSAAEGSPGNLESIKKLIAERLKHLKQTWGGPSWVTVTVLSGELHNFRIWFSDEASDGKGLPEEDSSGFMSVLIAGIVVCFGGIICAIVCCFKGPEDVQYQRLDKPGANTVAIGGMDEGDEVDVEMDTLEDPRRADRESDDEADEELEEVNLGGTEEVHHAVPVAP